MREAGVSMMTPDEMRAISTSWNHRSKEPQTNLSKELSHLWLALADLAERVQKQAKLINDLRFPPDTAPTEEQVQERSELEMLTERVEALEKRLTRLVTLKAKVGLAETRPPLQFDPDD
jgi:hypothetical protein